MEQLSIINAPDKTPCLLTGRVASGEGMEGKSRGGMCYRVKLVFWAQALLGLPWFLGLTSLGPGSPGMPRRFCGCWLSSSTL